MSQSPTQNVYWMLNLNVIDGKLDEFKALAAEMSDATRNETGCVAYEWHLSADNQTAHLYERYADVAATMEHLANFGKNFAGRFMDCVRLEGFQLYGAADETVLGALKPMGAVHYSQFAGFTR